MRRENTRAMPVFSKVLVANRGEIAVRVFRTLRELGIGTAAVYSEVDRGSLHAQYADEAYLVGPGPAAQSYLDQQRPLAIKAAAGGGGKGLKVVQGPDEAERAFESAQREGQAYFSDPTVYVERYLEDPRHVEVQVLADGHGNVIHLGERDCTIQRRHQKLVEETPSPAVGDKLRDRIGRLGIDAARAVGYRSAGTIEGLLDSDGDYFFLEMNTRIQVEHTVTDLVTGLDLVREQVLIAAGEPLSLRQDDVRLTGHAIECRINAEDPSNGFLPSPGRITSYREPAGPGVRADSPVTAGSEGVGLYDPLVAKLVVHGVDREHARRRMLRALGEFEIGGLTTLLGFHRALLG